MAPSHRATPQVLITHVCNHDFRDSIFKDPSSIFGNMSKHAYNTCLILALQGLGFKVWGFRLHATFNTTPKPKWKTKHFHLCRSEPPSKTNGQPCIRYAAPRSNSGKQTQANIHANRSANQTPNPVVVSSSLEFVIASCHASTQTYHPSAWPGGMREAA